MSSSVSAFGRMLRQLVDLGVIKLETEPLDALVVKRTFGYGSSQRSRLQHHYGLEQATHTFGIVRSLNLVGASLETLVDYLALGSFLSFE